MHKKYQQASAPLKSNLIFEQTRDFASKIQLNIHLINLFYQYKLENMKTLKNEILSWEKINVLKA